MEHRRAWIPMPDGARLAARLWVPDERPAAVVLEALPYRMDDLTSSYAASTSGSARRAGFAVCRVDLRGTGSSEGIAVDEYPPQEQADLCEVIAWLAAQEWCTGQVGMYGTSYSGFNSIQLAMERRPRWARSSRSTRPTTATRTTSTTRAARCAAIDLVDYVLYMAAMNVLPPVPAVFGDGWRDEWLRRIEGAEPWLLRWLEEQVDGPYWRHGSLRPTTSASRARRCSSPAGPTGTGTTRSGRSRRSSARSACSSGPWSHMSTATSLPGPHIDLVPELIRWFGRWLRDEENGVDEEPPIQVFVRRSTRPEPDLAEVRGEWRSEPGWPLERARADVLSPSRRRRGRARVEGDVGTAAWISCAGRLPWGQPTTSARTTRAR